MPVNATTSGAAQTAAAQAAASQASSSTGTASMSSDAFLKLLVAQLKYQDPTKPVDTQAFMAQTAQLQMVQEIQQLVEQNTALVAGQNAMGALSLVGQKITYSLNGTTASGQVDAVRLGGAGPVLVVGATEIPLGAVTQVGTTPPKTA